MGEDFDSIEILLRAVYDQNMTLVCKNSLSLLSLSGNAAILFQS